MWWQIGEDELGSLFVFDGSGRTVDQIGAEVQAGKKKLCDGTFGFRRIADDKLWRTMFTCALPRQNRSSSSTVVLTKSGQGYLIMQYAKNETALANVTDRLAHMIAKSPP